MGKGVQNYSFMDGSPPSSEIYLFQERIAKNEEVLGKDMVSPSFSCWTG